MKELSRETSENIRNELVNSETKFLRFSIFNILLEDEEALVKLVLDKGKKESPEITFNGTTGCEGIANVISRCIPRYENIKNGEEKPDSNYNHDLETIREYFKNEMDISIYNKILPKCLKTFIGGIETQRASYEKEVKSLEHAIETINNIKAEGVEHQNYAEAWEKVKTDNELRSKFKLFNINPTDFEPNRDHAENRIELNKTGAEKDLDSLNAGIVNDSEIMGISISADSDVNDKVQEKNISIDDEKSKYTETDNTKSQNAPENTVDYNASFLSLIDFLTKLKDEKKRIRDDYAMSIKESKKISELYENSTNILGGNEKDNTKSELNGSEDTSENPSKSNDNLNIKNAFKETNSQILNDFDEDIRKPRNKFAHYGSTMNDAEFIHEVWNSAQKYLDFLKNWEFPYRIKDKIEVYDQFCNEANRIFNEASGSAKMVISVGGKSCTTVAELIDASAQYWDVGEELLKANVSIPELIKTEKESLLPTYELIQGIVKAVRSQEQKRRIEEVVNAKERRHNSKQLDLSIYADYKLWYDACMFKFIYGLMPEYSNFAWQGSVCSFKDFPVRYLFPALEYNVYSAVRKWITDYKLDVLAEYGLFSYLFTERKKKGIGNITDQTISSINQSEIDILSTDNYQSKDRSQYCAPLYVIYEDFIKLALLFDNAQYKYPVRGLSRNENISVDTLAAFNKLILQRLNNVKDTYYLIDKNSFSNFRAWAIITNPDRENQINNYFKWFIGTKNNIYGLRQQDDQYISFKYDAHTIDYGDFVSLLHKNKIPANYYEMVCMTINNFSDAFIDEAQLEEENINIEEILKAYLENVYSNDIYEGTAGSASTDIIPFENFKDFSDGSTDGFDKDNVEECLTMRAFMDYINQTCNEQVDHKTYYDKKISLEQMEKTFEGVSRSLTVQNPQLFAARYYVNATASRAKNGINKLVDNINNYFASQYEYILQQYQQLASKWKGLPSVLSEMSGLTKELESLKYELRKALQWSDGLVDAEKDVWYAMNGNEKLEKTKGDIESLQNKIKQQMNAGYIQLAIAIAAVFILLFVVFRH